MNDFIWLIVGFIAFDLLILAIVIWMKKRRGLSESERKFYRSQWAKIMETSDSHRSIMEADKLMAAALKRKGYQGTVGEQLKHASGVFTHLNDVWYAHKTRNRLAHELNVSVNSAEAARVLRCFHQALKDLDVL